MKRLIPWRGPLLFGLLVYFSINGFIKPTVAYNHQVAGYVLAVAAALLLFAVFKGLGFKELQPVLPIALALAISAVISTWNAPAPYFATNRDELYYAVILLGIGLYLLHQKDGTAVIKNYFAVIPLVHMIFLVYVIFYVVHIQTAPDPTFEGFPDFANIRHFAYFGFMAAACAASLFVMSRKLQATAFVMTAAALFGIVLLGARGALLAWLVFIICFAPFCRQRRRFLLFCFAALALAMGVVWYLTVATSLIQHVPSLFQRMEPGGSGYMVTDRISIWLDALQTIIKRPWFGYGPDAYISSGCCNRHVVQPHDFILQFLLEFGVIGVALMTATAWAMLRARGGLARWWTDLHSDIGLLAVSAVLAGFFAYALIDGLFYHAIPLTHFALFAALMLASMNRRLESDPAPMDGAEPA